MRRINVLILILPIIALCCSCRSGRELPYLSDATYDSAYAILHTYDSDIHVGDRLYIHVDCESPESAIDFNQETNKLLVVSSNANKLTNQEGLTTVKDNVGFGNVVGYLVSQQGEITFPIIGKVKAVNVTQDSLARLLEKLLKDGGYVSDPVVTIRLMNFHVSVVGEVKTPMMVYAEGRRLTVLEALAEAGDVSFYGRRDSIRIVRDEGNGAHLATIDLTKTEFLNSPYYYLQPNDIIYVEANKRRKHEARDNDFVQNVISYSGIMKSAVDAARQLEQAQSAQNR